MFAKKKIENFKLLLLYIAYHSLVFIIYTFFTDFIHVAVELIYNQLPTAFNTTLFLC